MLILNEVLVPSISISILNFDDDQYEALGYSGCLVRFKTARKVLYVFKKINDNARVEFTRC